MQCEGSTWHVGNGYALEPRLEPVRSAVRENVLWAAVQLCTHRLTHEHGALELVNSLLTVCETDTNVCSIGFAMDALQRLQLRSTVAAEARAALASAHSGLAVRCPETLARTSPPGFDLSAPELWPQLTKVPALAQASAFLLPAAVGVSARPAAATSASPAVSPYTGKPLLWGSA
jgi:hypothetical protein